MSNPPNVQYALLRVADFEDMTRPNWQWGVPGIDAPTVHTGTDDGEMRARAKEMNAELGEDYICFRKVGEAGWEPHWVWPVQPIRGLAVLGEG